MIKRVVGPILAACIASVGFAGVAAAQNYDGNGLIRFGIFGGGEFYNLKRSTTGDTSSVDGAMGGFSAGYDMIFGRQVLLGIEADLQVGDTHGTLPAPAGTGVKTTINWMSTLRGRAGFYVTPDFLAYGTGGVSWAGMSIRDTTVVLGITADTSRAAVGWVAGGGLEYNLRDYFGTVLFGEYLVGSYDTWANMPGLNFNVDTDVQTFRVGAKFKLGHDYYDDVRGRSAEPLK